MPEIAVFGGSPVWTLTEFRPGNGSVAAMTERD